MEAVWVGTTSALSRGRRVRGARRRTAPVTFAEIKEVDEESAEAEVREEPARRRPDVLDERLGRQFLEFRRRRIKRDVLREPEHELPPRAGGLCPVGVTESSPSVGLVRADSEPSALHHSDGAADT